MWLVIKPSRDCYDYTQFGGNAQNVYESLTCGIGMADVKFSAFCTGEDARLFYCNDCMHNCTDLFGCTGVKRKQYCILNKQYSQEEYEELLPKIKAHMNEIPYVDKRQRVYKYGEFFPVELCPFKYNETDAQEHFPLSKDSAIDKGYKWLNFEDKDHQETVSWNKLPDEIKAVDQGITKEVILCKSWEDDKEKAQERLCTKVYKIIPSELKFYKKYNLPLPRTCPNCRHFERVSLRNPLRLYKRQCMKEGCNEEFETSYSPDRKEIVYCKNCYQQEVL